MTTAMRVVRNLALKGQLLTDALWQSTPEPYGFRSSTRTGMDDLLAILQALRHWALHSAEALLRPNKILELHLVRLKESTLKVISQSGWSNTDSLGFVTGATVWDVRTDKTVRVHRGQLDVKAGQ